MTPGIALALETQLVLAEAHENLRDVELARSAAVQAADEARRRLERDLHDGAQQRLLVVGMRLANEAEHAGGDAAEHFVRVASEVREALTELRRIGRGDAAVIAELGLDDAVTSLVGSSVIPGAVVSELCDGEDHDCWPMSTATTTYRLLIGSMGEAQRSGATYLSIELRCLGDGHGRSLRTHHDGDANGDRSADHDRVLAAGGRIVDDRRTTAGAFEVWLP